MKQIFLILILLLPLSLQSTNQAPNSLKQQIVAAPKAPEFTIVEYFSLEQMQPSILNDEWYAFLTLKAPQKKFWLKYHVYLSTSSKTSNEESPTKVECQGTHNELHSCYISHKQINPKEENLRVEIVFQDETVVEMKIQINKMQEIKLGEEIVLQRNQPNFTRFFRIDLKEYTEQFDFVKIQLAEQYAVDQYTNYMDILTSLEETPPDDYRFNTESFPFWDNREMVIYEYEELQQAQCITILVGIVDLNTYRLTNQVIKNTKEVQKIEPNTNYYEIVSKSKNYRIDLPERSVDKYYLFRIKIESLFTYSLDNAKINGKSIARPDLQKALLKEGSTKSKSEIQLWLNSTILTFQFTLSFTFGGLFSLYLSQFDTSLIVLPQKVIWSDNLSPNQTQYLYLVINTKSGAETINLEVQAAPIVPLSLLTINFRNCVAKTVAECNQIARSKNQTKKLIGMPFISPKVTSKNQVNFYNFDDLIITKYEMQKYVYQSIIVIEVHSVPSFIYALSWNLVNPIQTISENQLVQATLEKDQVRIFSFTIFDASNLDFARVHFIHGTAASFIMGSTELLNLDAIQNNTNNTIREFDGSVTFTNLVSKKTYYVYVASWAKDIFELTLTYAYNLDDQLSHPITYLTLGNTATNQLILQPLEILFLEIRTNNSGLLTVENSRPLKICLLFQLQKPKSHQDMKSAENCQTFSTVNHFYTLNYENTGKFYVGIENQRSSASSISLTTETSLINCPYTQMGRTKYLLVDKNKTQGEDLCVNFPLSQKGEVQILVDINNPRLQGIAHPQVSIGQKWQTIMNTNLLLISAEDIDTYCQQSYDHCFLIVQIIKNQENKIFQQYIAVTVSYTSQPLVLKEGLAHHSHIRPNQVKHFKYPIYSDQSINAEVQTSMYESLIFYAQLITSDEKFKYPKKEDYQNNITGVYKSNSIGYFYPTTLTISSEDLKKKCVVNKNCYALYSVYSVDRSTEGKFVFQVTQTINTLTSGSKVEKYLEKDSKAYFNFKNSQAKSLLFFTTSNTKDCLKIDIYIGNDGANSQNSIKSGKDQVLIQNAKKGWYTAKVQASQNCFFAIQVSSSQRGLKELSFGYANYFDSTSGEKKYYMVHNNLDTFKIIASLDQNIQGQLILQAMPVTEKDIGDFIKFINNELDITKKSRLNFVWSDINHLTLRKNDPLYCKDCYICIQAQSTTDMNGYLTIPSAKQSSLYLKSYISYDILLKGEAFTWIVMFDKLNYDIFVAVQAGELELTVQNSFRQSLQTYHLKYDKTDPQKNVLHVQNVTNFTYENIKFVIKAVQNLDYSIYSKQKNSSAEQPNKNYVEIGRPNYVYAYPGQTQCFVGLLTNQENQFMLTTSLSTKDLGETMRIKGYLSGKQVPLKIQSTPTVVLFSFGKGLADPKSTFKICFENGNSSDTLSANFMYLGNLNYFPENSVLHLKGSVNLTFMSQGRGTIEIDQCASRSAISLNRQYKDIKSMNSKVNSRRMPNNLISFNQYGTVYMHVDSKDYVALSWKNLHETSKNGFGYDIYLPSTFRTAYDTKTRDITIKIKPLEVSNQATFFPKILEINYKIYVASEELDLYNAMNCQKGKFMYWIKQVTNPEEINKEATILLNNIADLKNLFNGKEYVLIIVKAEAIMKWQANNFTQSYRFYYPYQQLILSQFSDELSKQDDKTGEQTSQGFSTTFTVIFCIIAVIIVAVLTYSAIQFMKRRMWRTGSFADQDDSHGTELQSKVKSGSINSDMR